MAWESELRSSVPTKKPCAALGIAVCGLNGAGKSTLAHLLAQRTGWFEMDAEDYYFPEQRDSRRSALEGGMPADMGRYLGGLPFSVSRTKDEVSAAMLADMRAHPHFILAGVTMNWPDEILERIGMAFYVTVPAQERVRRIQMREQARFGERVLPGGDMYAQQCEFRKTALERDPAAVEESLKRLKCPVVLLDGTLAPQENLKKILERLEFYAGE